MNTVTRNIDAGRLIDERPISRMQILVFVLCALVALLDGIDSQSIGVAGPLMAAELGMKMSGFAPVISAGLFGATIGALTFGPIGDRVGRKPALVTATVIFAVFTLLTPLATTLPTLVAVRFVAGLGLGGATPCFITLAADYAPRRRRAMLSSLLWSAYPLGNGISGFMSGYIVSHYPWRVVFYAGGIPAAVTAAVLAMLLPESLRFVASAGRNPRLAERLARRLDPALPPGDLHLVLTDEPKSSAPLRALFREGRAASTLLLWLIFFLAFGTTTILVLWTPTLLKSEGVPLGTAASLVGIYSLAAVAGMAVAGHMVARFGAVAALMPAFILGAVLLAGLGTVASSLPLTAACMVLLGLAVPMGAAGGIAIAATYYPTEMRTSGVGWAMGMGRFGQVCSPLAIGLMLSIGYGPAQILAVMAAAPLVAGLAVLVRASLGSRSAALRPVAP